MEQVKLISTEMQQKMQYAFYLVDNYAKNDTQKEVVLANYNRTLKEFDLTDANDAKDLIKLLSEWRMMLGIKENPTGEESAFNCKFIKEEYSDFTIEKIKLAIKYSLRGELDVDIKPYGTFSPLYISTILNAYKKYDNKIVSEVLRAKNNAEMLERNSPKVYTEEERIQNRIDYLEFYKNECTQKYTIDYKNIMWDFLSTYKLIDGIEPDMKLVEKERMIKLSHFEDFSQKTETDIIAYSIMKKFFEQNQDFDFKNYKLL